MTHLERADQRVTDISAKVSTNHVYKLEFEDQRFIVAKLSWFGKYEHFKEDHNIIHVLGNSLTGQFENFLARSLTQITEAWRRSLYVSVISKQR